jgi:hypothetical protein
MKYPKGEEERKKYKGLEAYPFFSYSGRKGSEGGLSIDQKKWMLGAMAGFGGLMGLFAGGQRTGKNEGEQEDYLRTSFMMRNFGPLSLMQLGTEHSSRPEFGAWRHRLEAAAQFNLLDTESWKLQTGGRFGYTLPGGGREGAAEGGGNLAFYYMMKHPDFKHRLKTGLEFSVMDRPQDVFDPSKGRMTSFKGGINLLDFIKFSVEYHKFRGVESPGLPESDWRFMIYPGAGYLNF